ncbi:MAG: ankyrin repeat domain-containing protein, partial [Wolbachia sp.]
EKAGSPDVQRAMLEASNYYAFRWAAEVGHTQVLDSLWEKAGSFEGVQCAMLKAENYRVLANVIKSPVFASFLKKFKSFIDNESVTNSYFIQEITSQEWSRCLEAVAHSGDEETFEWVWQSLISSNKRQGLDEPYQRLKQGFAETRDLLEPRLGSSGYEPEGGEEGRQRRRRHIIQELSLGSIASRKLEELNSEVLNELLAQFKCLMHQQSDDYQRNEDILQRILQESKGVEALVWLIVREYDTLSLVYPSKEEDFVLEGLYQCFNTVIDKESIASLVEHLEDGDAVSKVEEFIDRVKLEGKISNNLKQHSRQLPVKDSAAVESMNRYVKGDKQNDEVGYSKGKVTSGANKPASWINGLFSWVKDSVGGLFSSRAALPGNVSTQSLPEYTALHYAAGEGNLNFVKHLVNKGADISAKDEDGRTPLDIANLYGKSEVADFLEQEKRRKNQGNTQQTVRRRNNKHGRHDRREMKNDEMDYNKAKASKSSSTIDAVKGVISSPLRAALPERSVGSAAQANMSSTKSPALLASGEQDNATVTTLPEINTTVVNNTIMLGILATSLFNKTKHKQPIHENLLSPIEQSMRLNNIDKDIIIRAIQQYEENFGDPGTNMDKVEIRGSRTEIRK